MKNKKILHFTFRGEYYEVNEDGAIKTTKSGDFSPTWLFLGGTKHHWSNHVTISLKNAFENPELLNGCLGFDKDHGTTRQWAGSYYGKLPRITGAHVITL